MVYTGVEEVDEEQGGSCQPDDRVRQDLSDLLHRETAFGGSDFTFELRDEEEGEDGENHDQATQDEEQSTHGDDVTTRCEVGNQPRVEEAQDQTCKAIEGVRKTNVARVAIFIRDQSHKLVTDTPPNENGCDAHCDKKEANGGQRGEHCVPEGEQCSQSETDPRKGPNANDIRHNTGGEIAHKRGHSVCAQKRTQRGGNVFGRSTTRGDEGLTQRFFEDILKIGGGVNDRATDRDQDQKEDAVTRAQVARFSLCRTQHVKDLSITEE